MARQRRRDELEHAPGRQTRSMADKSKTKSKGGSKGDAKRALRPRQWFDKPDNPGMTPLYLERYLNFGLTPGELRSGKPIIGIAQTGSDLSPCNRHHIE